MDTCAWFIERPMSFEAGFELQTKLHSLRVEESIPDTILFLQHTPVVTLGTRGRTDALLSSPEVLQSRGVDYTVASRGGDATYHAPGQLVMYPILKLGRTEADSRGYLFNLEEVAIRTCESFGVSAHRREGMNGAWTEQGKISAIGFRIRRWVTLHGLSFNVDVDLDGFANIVPCGLTGEPVARLVDLVSDSITLSDVRDAMASHVAEVMMRPLDIQRVEELTVAEVEPRMRRLSDH